MPDAPLRLPAELTIYTAAEWHPRLPGWVDAAQAADAADDTLCGGRQRPCDEVDAAGLQLLVSLANSAGPPACGQLVLQRPAQPLAAACHDLGATFLLARGVPTETIATP
jgi:hypothetical protein